MMIYWNKKPLIVLGIGVGVGVITCVVHILRRKGKPEILRTSSNRVSRTIRIPKGFVGHVLGRKGATIKAIREKSKARIIFDDEGPDFTVATVNGTPDEVEEAIAQINQIISERRAVFTEVIDISEDLTESIWKNVHCIKQICEVSRAKITFDFTPSKKETSVNVIIKGSKEEVDKAVTFINELIAEVTINSNKSVHVAGRALPENMPLHPSVDANKNLPSEKLISSSSDGFVEVYVSAVENPSNFWVQISGAKSIQLDKLATEMTEFYNDEKNKMKFNANNVNVGDIVAAFYQGDGSWYRGQVLKVSEEENGPVKKKITVFYLDFGDYASLDSSCISLLKPDYLSIPFQAIACCLANAKPLHDEWSQEAIEEFEKMVYLGHWKVMMAKPCNKEIKNGEKCETDSLQLVELYDTNTSKDVNVASELVSRGLAKFLKCD